MTEVHFWKAGDTLEPVQLLGKQPLRGKEQEEHTVQTSACWLSLKMAHVEFLGGNQLIYLAWQSGCGALAISGAAAFWQLFLIICW